MLYDGQNRIIELINAERLSWMAGSFDVKPRKVCALAFRIQGSADMICAGKRYFIDSGDVLYMPQGLGYQVDYSDTQMIAFHFVTQCDDPAPEVYRLQNRSAVHQLMLQAADVWTKKEPGYLNYCMGFLYQVLGELCAQKIQTQLPAHFQKAVTLIHQHFREPLEIAGLCSEAGISPTAFRQYFRQYYRQTPTDYIRMLRLEYARNLIAGDTPVAQAASECGIPDPKYFARLVKQFYGCTPRQLKLHGK